VCALSTQPCEREGYGEGAREGARERGTERQWEREIRVKRAREV